MDEQDGHPLLPLPRQRGTSFISLQPNLYQPSEQGDPQLRRPSQHDSHLRSTEQTLSENSSHHSLPRDQDGKHLGVRDGQNVTPPQYIDSERTFQPQRVDLDHHQPVGEDMQSWGAGQHPSSHLRGPDAPVGFDKTDPPKPTRAKTRVDEPPSEEREPNKYVFRRPRALQVEHRGQVLEIGADAPLNLENPITNYSHISKERGSDVKPHHPESLKKQRERLDLFIDLLFVGVVSNISQYFFDEVFSYRSDIAVAVGHFILLFMPAWRLWQILHVFLNSYFMDDLLQRVLVVWVLVLALVWGNNAPFFFGALEADDSNGSNFLIVSYLLATISVTSIEMLYSIWLPWLRRVFLLGFLIGLPTTAFWILTTLSHKGDRKIWFLFAAIAYDALEGFFMATPLADKLIGGDTRKTFDVKHTMSRYENFFIITLGEGVFLLIKDSPLGQGLTSNLGRGIQALLIYFYLAWTYFHGDMSKTYVHPLYRRWWIKWLWITLHIPMFAVLIMLNSGIIYLVQYGQESGKTVPEEQSKRQIVPRTESSTEPIYDDYWLRVAVGIVCTDVAIVMLCQMMISFLNKSMDARRELLVGRKYVRMLPRLLGIIALALLWMPKYTDPVLPLGIVLGVVFFVSMWEFIAGFDRDVKLFEPADARQFTGSFSSRSREPAP